MGYIGIGQQSGSIDQNSDFANLPRFPLSGIYSAMDSFATKMNSLPLHVVRAIPLTESGENTLAYSESRPALRLQLAEQKPVVLNCFASGQGAIPVSFEGEGIYEVRAEQALSTGRSRYNCTQASEWPGRFYWYSFAWIRRDADGLWSHQ